MYVSLHLYLFLDDKDSTLSLIQSTKRTLQVLIDNKNRERNKLRSLSEKVARFSYENLSIVSPK